MTRRTDLLSTVKYLGLSAVLAGVSLMGAEIGKEDWAGQLRVRTIETSDDVTVFVTGNKPEVRALEVTAITFTATGARIPVRKVVEVSTPGFPTRVTLTTEGNKLQEIRINELSYSSSQVVR